MNYKNSGIHTGIEVTIADSCVFKRLKGKNGKISFGDYCTIYENCRFLMDGEFRLGDYGVIHNNTLISGYKPCIIGHNAWIGQNSIINSTDTLKIGNNLGIGTDSKFGLMHFMVNFFWGVELR